MKDDDEFIITGFQLKKLHKYTDLDFICQAVISRKIIKEKGEKGK